MKLYFCPCKDKSSANHHHPCTCKNCSFIGSHTDIPTDCKTQDNFTLSFRRRRSIQWFRLYGTSRVVILTDIQMEILNMTECIRLSCTHVTAGIQMADRKKCEPHVKVKCHSLVPMWLLSSFNLI
jgi:hypothetical protein